MDKLERHMDLQEIADLTGMSRDWARRAWRRGEFGNAYIDTSRNCTGQEPRIPESAVKAYLQRRTFTLTAAPAEKIRIAG